MLGEIFDTLSSGKLAVCAGLISAVVWGVRARKLGWSLEKGYLSAAFAHTAAIYVYVILFFAFLADEKIFIKSITQGFGQGEMLVALFVSIVEAAFGIERVFNKRSAA